MKPTVVTTQVETRERAASAFTPTSINKEAGTVDAIFATDTLVRTWLPEIGEYYEELGFEAGMINLERFNTSAPVLDNHRKYDDAVGTVMNASISGKSLVGKIRFDIGDEKGLKAFGKVERGFTKSVSVGYRVHKLRYISDHTDGTPIYKATLWEPMELSTAQIPADIRSSIRTENISKNNLTISKKQTMETTQTEKPTAQTEAERTAAENNKTVIEATTKAERSRVSNITELATKHVKDVEKRTAFIKEHTDAGTTIEAVRALILDELVAKQPDVKVGKTGDGGYKGEKERGIAMTEGILVRMDPKAFPLPKERPENEFAHRTLMDLCDDFLVEKGLDTKGSVRQRAKRAMDYGMRNRGEGMTTSDFPLIFANILGKVLRKDYTFETKKWEALTYKQDATRINQSEKSMQLGDFTRMEKVLEGAEYRKQTVSEGAESFAVYKYGSEVGISLEMIINDDLGAIQRLAEKTSRLDFLTEDYIMWALLKSNPTMSDGIAFYHASHANLATGAALAIDKINELVVLLANQTGLGGTEPLDLTAKYILTGIGNRYVLDQILNKSTVFATKGEVVPSFIKNLIPIYTAKITDGSYYVIADPNQIDTIRIGGLVGEPGFTIEENYEYKTDSYVHHIRKYFGASYTDYRGFAKNPGA